MQRRGWRYWSLVAVALDQKSNVVVQYFAIAMLIAYVAGEIGMEVETRRVKQVHQHDA